MVRQIDKENKYAANKYAKPNTIKKVDNKLQEKGSAASSLQSDSSSAIFRQLNHDPTSGSSIDLKHIQTGSSLTNAKSVSREGKKPASRESGELKPNSRQRGTVVSRDSLSNLSELIELDPSLIKSAERLTPILDELNTKKNEENGKEKKKSSEGKKLTNGANNKNSRESNRSNRYTSIRNAQTNSEINKMDDLHESYAEQFYKQNSYMASWRSKFQENSKNLPEDYGDVNTPVTNDNNVKSVTRNKFKPMRSYEDMHFYDPLTEALVRPYYGNYPIANSDNFYTHNKLLDQWKEEKKELIEQQKEPPIHEILYQLHGNPPSSSYAERHEEQKLRSDNNGNLIPYGRYTIEDYRNLKKNMGFGTEFGKIRYFDPETREEKAERLHRRLELGNKFMKTYTVMKSPRHDDADPNNPNKSPQPAAPSNPNMHHYLTPRVNKITNLPAIQNNPDSNNANGTTSNNNANNNNGYQKKTVKNTESKNGYSKNLPAIQNSDKAPNMHKPTTNNNNNSNNNNNNQNSISISGYPTTSNNKNENNINLPALQFNDINERDNLNSSTLTVIDRTGGTKISQTIDIGINNSLLFNKSLNNSPIEFEPLESIEFTNRYNNQNSNNNSNYNNNNSVFLTDIKTQPVDTKFINSTKLDFEDSDIKINSSPSFGQRSSGSYESLHKTMKMKAVNGVKLYRNPRFKFGKHSEPENKNDTRQRAIEYAKAHKA